MNDLLEEQLRELYAEYDAGYDATPALARLRCATAASRRHRRRGRLWVAAGACGTSLAGGIVAAVLLLTAGTVPAYAGWSPTPRAMSAVQVRALTAACRREAGIKTNPTYPHGYHTGVVFRGRPVLTERRGVFTAAIYVTAGRIYSCLSGARGTGRIVHEEGSGPVRAAPSPGTISAPYGIAFGPSEPNGGGGYGDTEAISPWLTRLTKELRQLRPDSLAWQRVALQLAILHQGAGYGLDAYGQAGSNVSTVVFSFANGRSVNATVENGWYFAWWPWTSYPSSVQVSTRAGARSSPMTTTGRGIVERRPVPACRPGAGGCVFSSTSR